MTATALVFHGPGRPLDIQSVPLPAELASGELLVRLRLATVCGSDLHTIEGRRTEPTPAILGHEGVGVVEVSRRDEVAIGTRITWTIADSCGACDYCADYDLPEKCRSLFKYGHAPLADAHGLHGTYSSHVVVRAGTAVFAVADHLPDEAAAPANCALATSVNVVAQVPSTARRVLVQGAGLLGLYACALLRERGLESVLCSDPDEGRRQLARRFGADVCAPGEGEGGAVDAVLELSGARAALDDGLRQVRTGGTYVLAGMVHPESDLAGITGERLIRQCLTLRGVHNYGPTHLAEGLRFLEQSYERYPFADLVGPALPLSRFDEALDLSRQRRWPRVAVRADATD